MNRPARSPLRLDPKLDEPLFKQLFDQLVARIESGAFPPGYQLTPSRDMAGELGVHRNTVVRAYSDLEAAGFVTSSVGRGTFVNATSAPKKGVVEPEDRAGLPWRALISDAARSEPLARHDRLAAPGLGQDFLVLNRMQPSVDLLPVELFKRSIDHVLRSQGAKALGYAPREGLPRLRGIISEDLRARGVPARAEDILITTGSQQGLDLVSRALINPGDPFLMDSSTYAGALSLIAAAGANIVGVPTDDEGPQLSSLARHESSGAKGFYLMPNCHNPTGRAITQVRREALIDWSHRANVPLLEDDYGEGLNLEGEPPPPALRSFDKDVIHLGTYSKRLIPSLRIGFVVCPPPLRTLLVPLRHAMDLGTSLLLQHALAEFIERGYLRAHESKTVPEYRRRRDALSTGLRQNLPKDITFRHPDRGLVLWLPLRGFDPDVVYTECLRRGVLVGPGTLNAVDGHEVPGLRMTFCAESPERLAEAGKRVAEAVRAIRGESRDSISRSSATLEMI